MTPEEVSAELVSAAVDVWRVQDGSVQDALTSLLAAVLPAHRGMVADEIEAYGKALMDAAVDRVMSDDPAGQSDARRAATVNHVARWVRGEQ